MVVGDVDQELTLAAGIVDGHDPARTRCVRLREQDERGREFVHVARAVHAVAVEDRVVDAVRAGDRAGVRDGELRRELGAADLQRDDRDAALARLREGAHEAGGVARRLHEQADGAGVRHLDRKVEVLVHRDREFLPGRNHEVEVDPLLAIHDAAHARAGMADVGDVAAAAMLARPEAAGPGALGEVVEAHAVRAADDQSGLADLREHAVAQRRVGVVLDHERGHDRRRARAVGDHLVERRLDARVRDREDDVLDGLGQLRERRVAGHAEHRLAAGIDGVEAAFVAALQQVLDGVAADGAFALGGAEHRDRPRPEQGIEPMGHAGAAPGARQKSAAGVARLRGGSQNG